MIGPHLGGSPIPTGDPIVAPGASSTVDRDTIPGRTSNNDGKAAMEMPAPWKPQNGFHSALEISHTTRDSHIPTADHFVSRKKKRKRKTYDMRYARQLDRRPLVSAR
jgi:hypothetical protein